MNQKEQSETTTLETAIGGVIESEWMVTGWQTSSISVEAEK